MTKSSYSGLIAPQDFESYQMRLFTLRFRTVMKSLQARLNPILLLLLLLLTACDYDRKVTVYPLKKVDHEWRPFDPITFKVGENSVVQAMSGTLTRYDKCAILSPQDWECRDSFYGRLGFRKGKYWQLPAESDVKYVSSLEYNFVRVKWVLTDGLTYIDGLTPPGWGEGLGWAFGACFGMLFVFGAIYKALFPLGRDKNRKLWSGGLKGTPTPRYPPEFNNDEISKQTAEDSSSPENSEKSVVQKSKSTDRLIQDLERIHKRGK